MIGIAYLTETSNNSYDVGIEFSDGSVAVISFAGTPLEIVFIASQYGVGVKGIFVDGVDYLGCD